MSTTIPDLWPTRFDTVAQPSPVGILRQQGYLLGQKTRNSVVGQVRTTPENPARQASKSVRAKGPPVTPADNAPDRFTHTLSISAPLLDYRQRLLDVSHRMHPHYPAELTVYALDASGVVRRKTEAASASELMDALKEALSTTEVFDLVSSLAVLSLDDGSEPG